nr:hypothetical protein CFP56_32232 [Quercus suber]
MAGVAASSLYFEVSLGQAIGLAVDRYAGRLGDVEDLVEPSMITAATDEGWRRGTKQGDNESEGVTGCLGADSRKPCRQSRGSRGAASGDEACPDKLVQSRLGSGFAPQVEISLFGLGNTARGTRRPQALQRRFDKRAQQRRARYD